MNMVWRFPHVENPVLKLDEDRQVVLGAVYIPDFVDSQGDWATADEIEKAAYEFMAKGDVRAIDTNHDMEDNGGVVVESFIARKGDPDFVEGSWVLGVKLTDDLWDDVKKGELNGFSMFGKAVRTPGAVEVEIPDDGVVKGDVQESDDHTHRFIVKFDVADGKFLGGETDQGPDGHTHVIKSGTVTEEAGVDGHSHRYSWIA